jgi:predicted permease
MFWNDVRFGLRMLRRDPAFTAVAVVTLALGIGANTAIFTLFNTILLQSLPVREPTRLVLFSDTIGEGTSTGSAPPAKWPLYSYESFEFLRDAGLPLEGLAAVRSGQDPVSLRLPGAAQAERAQAQLVSGAYFSVMGVRAAAGRTLTLDDDRAAAPPAAVVSHAFWSDRLHADQSIVGAAAIINNTAFTIVGVAPREFFGERVRKPPDVWVPLVFQPQIELRPSYLDRTDSYWLSLIGRLAPGATRPQAQSAATDALHRFLAGKESGPLTEERRRAIQEARIELADGAAGVSNLRLRYSEPLHILLGVVGLVLLLACANVGNLLLARAAARRQELTVRLALGAGRWRLMRQLLTESLVLAVLGAVGGVLLARWVVNVLLALIVAPGSPVHGALDGTVLGFTIAVACTAGILFGLAPALAAGNADLQAALKSRGRGTIGGRGGAAFTRALVVGQIAISLVLLVGANLFARSLVNLETQAFGFDRDHVLLARIYPRLAGYTPEAVGVLYRKLFDRVSALPGVRSATVARYSPMGGSRSANSGVVEGYTPNPGESVQLETIQVGPAYPETLGLTLLQGRAIGIQDTATTPKVGMVTTAFVRKYFPNQNPIGRRFGVSGSRRPDPADLEIVGVLDDARFQNSADAVLPVVFTALLQDQSQFALDAEVEIRTSADPATAAAALRKAIADVDPNLPVNDPKPLRDQVASNFDSQRLAARLVGFFGGLALLLACVGLYGVLTQTVVNRTNEIGVRMALGAQRRDVMRMMLGDVVRMLALGFVAGVPAAAAATRLVSSQIFGMRAAAPASFALAIVVLGIVALATGFVPVRRATRLDPLIALRDE